MIHQGDVYWIDLGQPIGSEPAYIHPYVVIQNDLLNRSQIRTVIVCALTTNLRRAKAPGNVLLEVGEADLPGQSVVNVSQVFTVDKALLTEKIGSLSRQRIQQILAGLALVTQPEDTILQTANS
ncbi:MAG: type II toxin-antitoxin system PemK/MazF family toxin [Scytonema sp. PMC 1069.18]|nr:type II toxin-antitoxin system PemK/MazF family toxin [Scytonema sp. PMC 1069.18]MEC4884491.1 type II toxin-antitoxin system PemK/MazF family toxin [Scytonema sp. PMC 1070.18]